MMFGAENTRVKFSGEVISDTSHVHAATVNGHVTGENTGWNLPRFLTVRCGKCLTNVEITAWTKKTRAKLHRFGKHLIKSTDVFLNQQQSKLKTGQRTRRGMLTFSQSFS